LASRAESSRDEDTVRRVRRAAQKRLVRQATGQLDRQALEDATAITEEWRLTS
jgi:hypothetical protein